MNKYNLLDEVWFMRYNKPIKERITSIKTILKDGSFIPAVYQTEGSDPGNPNSFHGESVFFKTKEELIASL